MISAGTAARMRTTVAAAAAAASARGFSVTAAGTELLQDSRLHTMHFQRALPRLAVPPLEDTMSKYLKALGPLVSPAQYDEAAQLVHEFTSDPSLGPALQAELIARDAAAPDTCYFGEWWYDMYLRDRQPIPINYNPQLTLKQDPGGTERNAQLPRAAGLIHASARFVKTLAAAKLRPDLFETNPARSQAGWFTPLMSVLPSWPPIYQGASPLLIGSVACGAYPLDMGQYKNLFGSTRVPGDNVDTLVIGSNGSTDGWEWGNGRVPARHIVVQRGSRFYSVDALREDGAVVPAGEILGALQQIVDADAAAGERDDDGAGDGASCAPGLGLLTTLPRDQWARARRELLAGGSGGSDDSDGAALNAASLAEIDSALFVVVLEDDEAELGSLEESQLLLTGKGANRWFDKSFSLVVCANGRSAVNFEHAWGDGVCVLRYCVEVFDAAAAAPLATAESPAAEPRRLGWSLSDGTRATLARAGEDFDAWLRRLHVHRAEVAGMGEQVPKDIGIGQDALLQMSIQLAHRRMHGTTVATYESANLAGFKGGRTETIRSASPESVVLCETMLDDGTSHATRAGALRAAAKAHGGLTKAAMMGQGCDRHLFALRKLAEARGAGNPASALFNTEAMAVWNKIILSTSTLKSHALEGGGFGPVNEDCYGIGYGMEADKAGFILSTYRPDGGDMAEALSQSLQDLVETMRHDVS